MGSQSSQQYTTFLVDKTEQIATVRLNRPAKLNPINLQVVRDLDAIVRDLEDDYDTRVVILTGQGRAFSAGADFAALREPLEEDANDVRTLREKQAMSVRAYRVLTAWENLPQVTIAMVNGFAVGGGVTLMMSCDFRIAAESATMWIPEVDLGVTYMWNSLSRLIALVGAAKTRELVMLGDRLTAAEAERIGLVNRVVPDADLEATTMALAHRLCHKPPLALQRTKAQINALTATRSGDMSFAEPDLGHLCSNSADGREARAAFFEKRQPTYHGR
jgi:enoyl-CoA hydratase/carnithine racemase